MNLSAIEERYFKKQYAEVRERLINSGYDLSKIVLTRSKGNKEKETEFEVDEE